MVKNKKGFVLAFTVVVFLFAATMFSTVLANSKSSIDISKRYRGETITSFNSSYVQDRVDFEIRSFNSGLSDDMKSTYRGNVSLYKSHITGNIITPILNLEQISSDKSILGVSINSINENLDVEFVVVIKGGSRNEKQ